MRSERDNPILKGVNVFGDPASVELFKDARPQCPEVPLFGSRSRGKVDVTWFVFMKGAAS